MTLCVTCDYRLANEFSSYKVDNCRSASSDFGLESIQINASSCVEILKTVSGFKIDFSTSINKALIGLA